MFSRPPSAPKLLIGQTRIDFRAAEAFIADIYANAGIEIPENFNVIEETIKVVCTLRGQGKNENSNRSA